MYTRLNALGPRELERRHDLALEMFRNHGITFAVYPDEQGIEKVFPFDIIPRVISAQTWGRLEAGLKQRLAALNLFLDDVYGRKLILRQGVVPPEIVLSSQQYLREIEAGERYPSFDTYDRIEKLFEDARVGSVASYAERFYEIVGGDARSFLGVRPPAGDSGSPN